MKTFLRNPLWMEARLYLVKTSEPNCNLKQRTLLMQIFEQSSVENI